jgi:hypothetical protein
MMVGPVVRPSPTARQRIAIRDRAEGAAIPMARPRGAPKPAGAFPAGADRDQHHGDHTAGEPSAIRGGSGGRADQHAALQLSNSVFQVPRFGWGECR